MYLVSMATGSPGEEGGGCRGEDPGRLPWFPGQTEGQGHQVGQVE